MAFSLVRATLAATLLSCLVLSAACGGGTGDSTTFVPPTPPTQADKDYAIAAINAMRMREAPAAVPFVESAAIDTYSTLANDDFVATRIPHRYTMINPVSAICPPAVAPFLGGGGGAENQAVHGPGTTNMAAIDAIIAAFTAEKSLPIGDVNRLHYENVTNPALNAIGVGMARAADGNLFVTWDFCD